MSGRASPDSQGVGEDLGDGNAYTQPRKRRKSKGEESYSSDDLTRVDSYRPLSNAAIAAPNAEIPRKRLDDFSEKTPQNDEQTGQEVVPSLERSETKRFWKFELRARNDSDKQDWWFASTAIPLLAATLGPLANVLSIAALVSYWRMDLRPDGWQQGDELLTQLQGQTFKDPDWVYYPNLASLITGYIGNIFLLANFTNRIRYIVALPVTIILWYISTGLLITILSCTEVYDAPDRPYQTYTQGFWYGFIAAILYLICSMSLMLNMLGYFLGHYPQRFTLTEAQRTLILQTMLFFIWLAGGAAVFSAVESGNQVEQGGWSFSDALYFCDVTILTVGFGDLHATSNLGRGLVLPYAVGGIIMLGLMIGSISTFATELSQANIIDKHIEKQRQHTLKHTVTSLEEAQEQSQFLRTKKKLIGGVRRLSGPFLITRPVTTNNPTIANDPDEFAPPVIEGPPTRKSTASTQRTTLSRAMKRTGTALGKAVPSALKPRGRKPRLLLLREERDRFNAMRHIQSSTRSFKAWSSLTISVIAFAILWAVGAVVFWQVEKDVQGMTYFQALYLGYVSLLTIGYGDLAPQSNAGRPFFVVWSLLAVPSVTILISNMADTVIGKFKRGTNLLADFTVLPKYGIWRTFLEKHPWLLGKIQYWVAQRQARRRLDRGFQAGPPDEISPDPESAYTEPNEEHEVPPSGAAPMTLEQLAAEEDAPPSDHILARRLADAIRRTVADLKAEDEKTYSYEEWAELTQLIRFSRSSRPSSSQDSGSIISNDEQGLIEWDWIGADSPMMQRQTEAEFVLDRLCESMVRYTRVQAHRGDSPSGGKTPARPVVVMDDEQGETIEEEKRVDESLDLNAAT